MPRVSSERRTTARCSSTRWANCRPKGKRCSSECSKTRQVQAVGTTKSAPVDVQIILATNRNLKDEVAQGRFREDLYYRIQGLGVELVPLRDPRRLADIRPLLTFYLAKHERGRKKKTFGLKRDALRVLLQFSWPGNVRQLSHVCSCLVTHAAAGAWIGVEDVDIPVKETRGWQTMCRELLEPRRP